MSKFTNPFAGRAQSVGNPIGRLPSPVSRAKFTAPPPQTNAPAVAGAANVVQTAAKLTPNDAWAAAHKASSK